MKKIKEDRIKASKTKTAYYKMLKQEGMLPEPSAKVAHSEETAGKQTEYRNHKKSSKHGALHQALEQRRQKVHQQKLEKQVSTTYALLYMTELS